MSATNVENQVISRANVPAMMASLAINKLDRSVETNIVAATEIEVTIETTIADRVVTIVVEAVVKRAATDATSRVTLLETVTRAKSDAIDAINQAIMPKSAKPMSSQVRAITAASLAIYSVIVQRSRHRQKELNELKVDFVTAAINRAISQETVITILVMCQSPKTMTVRATTVAKRDTFREIVQSLD